MRNHKKINGIRHMRDFLLTHGYEFVNYSKKNGLDYENYKHTDGRVASIVKNYFQAALKQ